MTKFVDWRENWVCFSSPFDEEHTDLIVELLIQEGVKQHWWSVYGSLRAILDTMGLDNSHSHIFHGTKYVGSTLTEVKTYIYTMKRIHGEPV